MMGRDEIAVGSAYLVVLAVAGAQVAAGVAPSVRSISHAAPYAAAGVVFVAVARAAPAASNDVAVRRWLAALAVGGGALGAWLVVRFLVGVGQHAGQPHDYYRIKVAVTSPVGDHNTVAGLLLVGALAAVTLASTRARWSIPVVLTAVGLIATMSRGAAVIMLVAAVASWRIVSRRRIAALLSLVAVAVGGGIAALAFGFDASPPPGAPGEQGALGASLIGRVDLMRRGLSLGWDHPALGVGFGGFPAYAADLPPPNHHAHQLVGHAVAEGGLLVAAAVVVLSLLLILRSMALPRSPLRDVVLLGSGMLVAHAQVEILGGLASYEVLIAVLLGLAVAGSRVDRTSIAAR